MTYTRTDDEIASDEANRAAWNGHHATRNHDALSNSPPQEVLNHHRVSHLIRPGLKVLDIGVGMGRMARCLHERECVVDCVDVADAAEEYVRTHARSFYQAARLDRLPSNEYDLAISMLVAQHMCDRNLRDQIANVYRALRVGGIFSLHVAGATSGELSNMPGPIPPGKDGAMCRNIDYMFGMIQDILPAGHAVRILDHILHWPKFGSYWYFLHILKESA